VNAKRRNIVDVKDFVRHVGITMKTATVRDLRNRFAGVAKWIESGEQVTITRNGVAFATLAPAKPQRRRKVDWATRLKRYKPAGRKLTKEETEAFWSTLRD
jgi:antitoxin (DNA-binding transcriptional repressor) of toxin-antitoxin stability system